MLNPLKNLKMGGEVEMLRGEEPMRKLNLCLRKGLQIKKVSSSPKDNYESSVFPKGLTLLMILREEALWEVSSR